MKEKPTKAKKKGRTIRAFKRDISLWLFCVPGVILTFIFSYIPMYGVQIAFRRFNATAGITKSPWVQMGCAGGEFDYDVDPSETGF